MTTVLSWNRYQNKIWNVISKLQGSKKKILSENDLVCV